MMMFFLVRQDDGDDYVEDDDDDVSSPFFLPAAVKESENIEILKWNVDVLRRCGVRESTKGTDDCDGHATSAFVFARTLSHSLLSCKRWRVHDVTRLRGSGSRPVRFRMVLVQRRLHRLGVRTVLQRTDGT